LIGNGLKRGEVIRLKELRDLIKAEAEKIINIYPVRK